MRRSSPQWDLAFEDLRGAIMKITTDSPKGSIDGATRTYTIYDNDQLLNAQPWNDASSPAPARRCACETSAKPSRARTQACCVGEQQRAVKFSPF